MMDKLNITALSLEVTKKCNLRCNYCYLSDPNANSFHTFSNKNMSHDIGKKSIDFLFDNSPENSQCYVNFIGGEPLLNWPLITNIVEYSYNVFGNSEKNISFGLTTNGLNLTYKKACFLLKNKISILFSFDGSRKAQDNMRVFSSGKGSYDKVVKKLQMLYSVFGENADSYISIRSTITRKDIDLVGIAEHIESLGIGSYHLAPVTYSDSIKDIAITSDDLPKLFGEYKKLADRFYLRTIEGKFDPLSLFNKILQRIITSGNKTHVCGAGKHYFGVSTEGFFYLCHRFFGVESGNMGSINKGISQKLVNNISEISVDKKKECSSCWAKKYCGGPCYFDGYVTRKDYFLPNHIDCLIFRHCLSLGLEMYSRFLRENPDALNKIMNLSPNNHSGEAMGIKRNVPLEEQVNPDDKRTTLYKNYAVPCRLTNIAIHDFENESVVYNSEKQTVFSINLSAKAIWNLCDGNRDIKQICVELCNEFEATPSELLSDVEATILHFGECGLLEVTNAH